MGENEHTCYTYCEEQLRAAKHAAENAATAAETYIPPVGATPYDVCAVDRINELLGAIGRYINVQNGKRTGEMLECARRWSIELTKQIEVLSLMDIYNG